MRVTTSHLFNTNARSVEAKTHLTQNSDYDYTGYDMYVPNRKRTQRIEIRVTPQEKFMLRAAANQQKQSVGKFILIAAIERARGDDVRAKELLIDVIQEVLAD